MNSTIKLCEIKGCNNKHYARGYCSKHYKIYVRKTLCKVEGCKSLTDTKGYCQKHYKRWKKYGDPNKTYERVSNAGCNVEGCTGKYYGMGYCSTHYHKFVRNRPCKVEGCNNKSYVRGYCTTHYQRLLRNGNPLKTYVNMDHDGTCSVEGCEGAFHAHNLCERHYSSYYKNTESGKRVRRFSQTKRRAMKASAPINDYTRKEWSNCLKNLIINVLIAELTKTCYIKNTLFQ